MSAFNADDSKQNGIFELMTDQELKALDTIIAVLQKESAERSQETEQGFKAVIAFKSLISSPTRPKVY